MLVRVSEERVSEDSPLHRLSTLIFELHSPSGVDTSGVRPPFFARPPSYATPLSICASSLNIHDTKKAGDPGGVNTLFFLIQIEITRVTVLIFPQAVSIVIALT
jgi:hypothetical protein